MIFEYEINMKKLLLAAIIYGTVVAGSLNATLHFGAYQLFGTQTIGTQTIGTPRSNTFNLMNFNYNGANK